MSTGVFGNSRIVILCAVLPACVSPFDGLGQQVTYASGEEQESQLTDDRIEDKHPAYDPSSTTTEVFDGCKVTLNKSGTVTRLEVEPWADEEAAATRLFPDRGSALQALSGLGGQRVLPSMEVVNGALKPFNDGLYAAIEVAMLDGAPGLSTTTPVILDALLSRLEGLETSTDAQRSAVDSARVYLGAARVLSGGTPGLPEPLLSQAQAEAIRFQGVEELARPIGFYTWSEPLQRAFTLVRYLQNREDVGTLGAFAAMAVALKQDEALAARYQTLLALYAGLTNPYVSYTPASLLPYVEGVSSLDSVDALRGSFPEPLYACRGTDFAFLPASRSREADYFDALYCETAAPEGTNFLDALVEAIRSGALDLSLRPDSGWYDYQQWALETLLVTDQAPEKDHLLLTAAYKKKLVDTFKSILIQSRETHAAHAVAVGGTGLPPKVVDLYPYFEVEPFPTFYLRTARTYRFLATYLTAVLGGEFMQTQPSLREIGTAPVPLGEELTAKARLLYGLYLVSAKAIGLAPELLADELAELDAATCETAASAWLAAWQSDPEILADPRVVVPAGYVNGRLVLWAVIGVKALKISAAFVEGYEPEFVSGQGCEPGAFVSRDYDLLTEESVEVQVRREGAAPPTRAEFRALCDQKGTREAIVEALEAL